MNLSEYQQELTQDPEYAEAERRLRPFLDVGDAVLILRLEKGWSQTELARRAGTRQASISQLESALGNPSIRFLQKVAEALGVELVISLRSKEDVAGKISLEECVKAVSAPADTGTNNAAVFVPDWPRGTRNTLTWSIAQ
jgi:transcriptional regulator with XRE-family HTH domain